MGRHGQSGAGEESVGPVRSRWYWMMRCSWGELKTVDVMPFGAGLA